MRWMTMVAAFSMVFVLSLMNGCSGGNGPTPLRMQEPNAEQEAETLLGTMDDYRVEAVEEITPENAEAELERLQKEIESDIVAGD